MILRCVVFVVLSIATALAVAGVAGGQSPPACVQDPEAQPPSIEVTADYDLAKPGDPVYATHQLAVALDFGGSGNTVSDVQATGRGVPLKVNSRGGTWQFVATPDEPGPFPIAATWTEKGGAVSPCTGSINTSVDITPARSAKLVMHKDPVGGLPRGVVGEYEFDLQVPRIGRRIGRMREAIAKDGDLSPLTIVARGHPKASFPRRGVKSSRMTVPLRSADRDLRDPKLRIPGTPGFSPVRRVLCRVYFLRCGGGADVEIHLLSFNPGGSLIPRTSPRHPVTQGGVTVDVLPGYAGTSFKPAKAYGLEVTAFQSGRLVARFRVTGRCVFKPHPLGGAAFNQCRTAKLSTKLR